MKATKEAKQPDVNSIMVGCDLHSKNMLVKIAVGKEKPRTASYANTFAGRRRLIADLTKRSIKAGGVEVHVLYEASGLGWTLRDELTQAGMTCGIVAPTKVERSPFFFFHPSFIIHHSSFALALHSFSVLPALIFL